MRRRVQSPRFKQLLKPGNTVMQPAPQARPILILDPKATLSSMSYGPNDPGVSTYNESDEESAEFNFPTPRWGHTSITYRDRVYVIGGARIGGFLNDVQYRRLDL